MLPPLTFKRNTMVDLSPFLYVTDLAAEMEGLSSHVITRCVTSFSTSHDGPYLLTTYTENSSPTRAASDERKRYVRGGVYWRLEETSSSGDYGEVKLTPSLTSDFLTRTVTPTRRSQRNRYWLGGKNKIRTSTVSIATSNRKILSVCYLC